ncbi:MAG TPA: thio(seleno)oxazole modification radical SAM maturase SbtM, partial [Desulfatiglandales bacterium]|nr:thio(seleno)oxazole modification radical SAM maturase SbtM [Desulfatiglandales bacterium]
MTSSARAKREGGFPRCRSFVGEEAWDGLMEQFCSRKSSSFSRFLTQMGRRFSTPPFLPDLAKLEEAFETLKKTRGPFPTGSDRIAVNPSLQLLRLSWLNLTCLWESEAQKKHPLPGNDLALLWRHPKGDDLRVKSASSEDLLALKMVTEGIRAKDLASEEDIPIDSLEGILDRAARSGLVIVPASRIGRGPDFPAGQIKDERYFTAPVFTLQWHLTQACDLHCKHCYDRSDRYSLRLHEGLEILDGLSRFCDERHVRGQISFTGGNPLLYPRFPALYRAAKERNLNVAILGNPAPRERIEELSAIEAPLFYQVSLEGLEPHNDHIRGPGHFQRTLEFLDSLRGMGIYSMVMLTLTRDNIDQVIPLAEILRHKADLFTFNRLALVGQGANLHLPEKEQYAAFLDAYTEAAHTNPVICLKDNLINIVRYRKGVEPFGGCTGYGCGAAFNFVSLLP